MFLSNTGHTMNDAMHDLIIINALAVMAVKGIVESVQYMQSHGMTTNEAFNVIDAFDKARNRVLAGQVP